MGLNFLIYKEGNVSLLQPSISYLNVEGTSSSHRITERIMTEYKHVGYALRTSTCTKCSDGFPRWLLKMRNWLPYECPQQRVSHRWSGPTMGAKLKTSCNYTRIPSESRKPGYMTHRGASPQSLKMNGLGGMVGNRKGRTEREIDS